MSDDPYDESDLTSWTLGDVKSSGLELEGACKTTNCNRFVRYNVDDLIARFGADWRVPKMLPARCDGCGQPLEFELAALHEDEPKA
jgi:hypothetical protein